MTTITDVIGSVLEDSPFFVMMRIHGMVGTVVTQASITSIVAKLYELSGATPGTVVQTANLTIAAVIFDTLQTGGWTKDAAGYNFGHAVPASWMAKGGVRYKIEYLVTPQTGDSFYLPQVKVDSREYASS